MTWGHENMDSNNKTARLAGLLYLITVVTGIFSLIYVPSHINVHGDASATVGNIMASESLFRCGIAVGSVGYTAFLLLPLVLYKLLSPVNKNMAVVMVVFAVTCVPIYFVALANQLDALSLLDGDKIQNVFTTDQLHARVMSLIDAYRNRIFISEIFWGLWLLPFGYLVFKSGFLPKVLGIVLMIGCFSYLAVFFGEMLFPHYIIPSFVMWPAAFGEIGTCLWLLIVGVQKPTHGSDL